MRAAFLLLKDLQNVLKERFAATKFEAESCEQRKSPSVWIGHVTPKKSMPAGAVAAEKPKESGDPPFILVRPLDGEHGKLDKSNARIHEIKIGFICAVYSKESFEEIEAGYNDIMNMVDAVLFALNSKIYWEENHWKFNEPASWVMGLQKELSSIYLAGMHSHPFYGAAVMATFEAAALERPCKTETLMKGFNG